MKTRVVVVGIIYKNKKILILKRADTKKFYPGKWEFVSGFVKEEETAEETILREIKEELSINATIKKTGKVFEIIENDKRWIILPYLVETNESIKIGKEHVSFKWIKPEEIKNFNTVPELKRDLEALHFFRYFNSK